MDTLALSPKPNDETKAESIGGRLAPAARVAAPIEPEEAEEDGEELTAVHEARVPQTLTSPDKPTEKEVDEHYLTHLPYRNWCPVCVAAAGREDQHRRRKDAVDEGKSPLCVWTTTSSAMAPRM